MRRRERETNVPDTQHQQTADAYPGLPGGRLLEVQRDGDGEDDEVEQDVGGVVGGVGALQGGRVDGPVAVAAAGPAVPERRDGHARHHRDHDERGAPEHRHDQERPARPPQRPPAVEHPDVLRQQAQLRERRRHVVRHEAYVVFLEMRKPKKCEFTCF